MRDVQALNRISRLRWRHVEIAQALTFSLAPAFFRFRARHEKAPVCFRFSSWHSSPVVKVSRPPIRQARDQFHLGERQVRWVAIGSEAHLSSLENVTVILDRQGRVKPSFVGFPDARNALTNVDVTTVPGSKPAIVANRFGVKPGLHGLNWVHVREDEPDLNHIARLTVGALDRGHHCVSVAI